MNDESLYLQATNEVDSDGRNPALWAKAMTVHAGNLREARYEYIKLRVAQLAERENNAASSVSHTNIASEASVESLDVPYEEVTAYGCTYIPIEHYCKVKSVTMAEARKRIREGIIKGRFQGGSMYVRKEELGSGPVIPAGEMRERERSRARAEQIQAAIRADYAEKVNGPMGLAIVYYGIAFVAAMALLEDGGSPQDLYWNVLPVAMLMLTGVCALGFKGYRWAVQTVFFASILSVVLFLVIAANAESPRVIKLWPVIAIPALIAYRLFRSLEALTGSDSKTG